MDVRFIATREDGQVDSFESIMEFNQQLCKGVTYANLQMGILAEWGSYGGVPMDLGATNHTVFFDFANGKIDADGQTIFQEKYARLRAPGGRMRMIHLIEIGVGGTHPMNIPERAIYIIGWKDPTGERPVECMIDIKGGVVKVKEGGYS